MWVAADEIDAEAVAGADASGGGADGDRVRPVEVARIPHRGENILTAGADAEANVIVIDHVVAAHLFAAEAVPRTYGLFAARYGAGAGGQRPEADYRGEHAEHGASTQYLKDVSHFKAYFSDYKLIKMQF